MSIYGVGLGLQIKVFLVAVYFYKWPRLHCRLRAHRRRRRSCGGARHTIRRQIRMRDVSPEKQTRFRYKAIPTTWQFHTPVGAPPWWGRGSRRWSGDVCDWSAGGSGGTLKTSIPCRYWDIFINLTTCDIIEPAGNLPVCWNCEFFILHPKCGQLTWMPELNLASLEGARSSLLRLQICSVVAAPLQDDLMMEPHWKWNNRLIIPTRTLNEDKYCTCRIFHACKCSIVRAIVEFDRGHLTGAW